MGNCHQNFKKAADVTCVTRIETPVLDIPPVSPLILFQINIFIIMTGLDVMLLKGKIKIGSLNQTEIQFNEECVGKKQNINPFEDPITKKTSREFLPHAKVKVRFVITDEGYKPVGLMVLALQQPDDRRLDFILRFRFTISGVHERSNQFNCQKLAKLDKPHRLYYFTRSI
jgi:hypothetical protein